MDKPTIDVELGFGRPATDIPRQSTLTSTVPTASGTAAGVGHGLIGESEWNRLAQNSILRDGHYSSSNVPLQNTRHRLEYSGDITNTVELVRFPNEGLHSSNLTSVVVLDRNGSRGTARIVAGGAGHRFVEIELKPQSGRQHDFTVLIYGEA